MTIATCIAGLFAEVDSLGFDSSVYYAATEHLNELQRQAEEDKGLDGFGITTIIIVVVLVWSFFFMTWLNGRYWDRGIFPPFLRFKRSNYYEAVINLSVNIMRCDSDNAREKLAQLTRFMREKFPDIPGGVAESYRSAMSVPVSTRSVSAWLGKHLHAETAKTELLEFLFALAITDDVLGKKEQAVLLAFTQHVGLDTTLLAKLIDTHRRERAERLFDEQKRGRQSVTTEAYTEEKARTILGLSIGFTQDELKKAYRTCAKQYHPDKFMQASEEEKQQVSERFIEIQEAYEQLLDG